MLGSAFLPIVSAFAPTASTFVMPRIPTTSIRRRTTPKLENNLARIERNFCRFIGSLLRLCVERGRAGNRPRLRREQTRMPACSCNQEWALRRELAGGGQRGGAERRDRAQKVAL